MRLERFQSTRVLGRLMPDQRLLSPALGGAPARLYRRSFDVTGNGVNFPWLGLVWPQIMPTPTWRVLVRSIMLNSETASNFASIFWTKGPVGSWTPQVNGSPANEDGGLFAGTVQSICYLATRVAGPTFNEGDVLSAELNLPQNQNILGWPYEWGVGSTIPLSMRNSLTAAVILAVSGFQIAGTIRATFEWEETP